MDDTLIELLEGPVGTVVQVLAVGLGIAVLIWIVTGVRLVNSPEDYEHSGRRWRDRDDRRYDREYRPRLIKRFVVGALCFILIVPMALNPAGTVEWARERIESLANDLTSDDEAPPEEERAPLPAD